MNPTPKLREQAAVLCSAYASECEMPWMIVDADPRRAVGFTKEVARLASKAMWAVPLSKVAEECLTATELWACACSMLRTGWSPK